MLLSWLVFPALLLTLCVGCGLLVRKIAAAGIPAPLLAPTGLAFLIVLGEFVTIAEDLAELYTPLAVAAALLGIILALPRPRPRDHAWSAAAAAAVFAVYAGPIVLSGEATFAGYVKLDDTATWLAITDRVIEHGRDLGGLPPSSYEATLSFNLGSGYPIGAFLPLGLASVITGTDPAWLIQPYMAFAAAMLALCLFTLAGGLIRRASLRALVAAIAAQPALLFGYYLWGGVKELVSVAGLALLAALLPPLIRRPQSLRSVLPAGIAAAAVVGILSPGGAGIWVAPMLGLGLAAAALDQGIRPALRTAASLAAALAALCLPWLIAGGFAPRDAGALTDPRELGNLIEPLPAWQAFGIWPVGDFRLDPVDGEATGVLIAVVVAAALVAAVIGYRRRAIGAGLFCTALIAGTVGLVLVGSPWVDAKGLATASPAILFAGAGGAVALIDRGKVIEGVIAVAAIGAGVLWSNALAYDELWPAPRDRLAELERVGELIEGQGPALMTEYEPYGVRHFLRDADPEGASELRRRTVALSDGTTLDKGESADIDRFSFAALLEYRTLVLRRSPLASRPPLPFELVWEGDWFEVWQAAGSVAPLQHLGVGDPGPIARPSCEEIRRLAATPGTTALAVSTRSAPTVVQLGALVRPESWPADSGDPGIVYPDGSGTAEGTVEIPAGGEYGVWLGGSFRGEVRVTIDGEDVGAAEQVLDHGMQFAPLGVAELEPGSRSLTLTYESGGPGPGRGGEPFGMGPLVLSRATASAATVETLEPAAASRLCGRSLDWVAAFG